MKNMRTQRQIEKEEKARILGYINGLDSRKNKLNKTTPSYDDSYPADVKWINAIRRLK
jgi:hypothetical protein